MADDDKGESSGKQKELTDVSILANFFHVSTILICHTHTYVSCS